MTVFRQKDFSNYILEDMRKGATIGAGIGLAGNSMKLVPKSLPKNLPGAKKYNSLSDKKWVDEPTGKRIPNFDKNTGKTNGTRDEMRKVQKDSLSTNQRIVFLAGTTLLGAALGALVGVTRTLNDKWSQKHTNQRLTKPLERELKRWGYEEGKDYTFDPKRANEIPTKVCIVLSSASGELQTVINSENDRNLKILVDRIVKQSSGRIQASTQNNRFNEITITTEKNASKNVKQISSIIKSFVEKKYPVYIVEVG